MADAFGDGGVEIDPNVIVSFFVKDDSDVDGRFRAEDVGIEVRDDLAVFVLIFYCPLNFKDIGLAIVVNDLVGEVFFDEVSDVRDAHTGGVEARFFVGSGEDFGANGDDGAVDSAVGVGEANAGAVGDGFLFLSDWRCGRLLADFDILNGHGFDGRFGFTGGEEQRSTQDERRNFEQMTSHRILLRYGV